MVAGLDHEDAARFSFLLATRIILAAGVYKLPDLLGSNGAHVRGQVLMGSLFAAASAYLAVRFLMGIFETKNLNPFAVYSLVVGISTAIYFAFTW
jgi:undecaprenyl-diphosphatase